MAGHGKFQYIIQLLADGSPLKKQLQDYEGDISKLSKAEQAEIKKAVKTRIDGIKAAADAAKKSSNAGIFTAEIEKEVKELKGAFEELRRIFPYEEFAKGGKTITQSFNGMQKSLSSLTNTTSDLKRDILELRQEIQGLGFKGVVSEAEQVQAVIEKIAKGSIIPNLDKKSISEIKKFKETLESSLTSISVGVEIDYDGLRKIDLEKKLKEKLGVGEKDVTLDWLLSSEFEEQIDALPILEANVRKAKKGTEEWTTASMELAKALKTINALENAMLKHEKRSLFEDVDFDSSDIKGKLDEVFVELEKEIKEQKRKLGDATKSLIDGVSNVNIKLKLDEKDQEEFKTKINDFIAKVNKEIDKSTINIALDIKDKGITEEEMQSRITKAKEWRQSVADALNKDKEKVSVYFGVQAITNSLHDQLQKYFEENEIDIHINKDTLAQEIKAAIESGGITGGSLGVGAGGKVEFDPATLAKAVAAGMQAFFTGDFTSLSLGKPKAEETPAKKPKEKTFYLDPNNDYNREVAEVFREVVKYAQGNYKPNKDTKSFLDSKLVGTEYWDEATKSANLEALAKASAIDLVDVLSHITEKFGTTIASEVGKLAKTTKNQLIRNFQGEMRELAGTHNFRQISSDEALNEEKRRNLWTTYQKDSRFVSGLGKLRGVSKSDVETLELPETADIDALIEYVKGKTVDQSDVDEINRLYEEQKRALDQAKRNFKKEDLDDVSEQVKEKTQQLNVAKSKNDTKQIKSLQAELDALTEQENQLKQADKTLRTASNNFEKIRRKRNDIIGNFNRYNPVLEQLEAFKAAREDITDVNDSAQKEQFLSAVSEFSTNVRGIYDTLMDELKQYNWGIEIKGFKDIYEVNSPGRVDKLDRTINGNDSQIVRPHLYKAPNSPPGLIEERPLQTDILRQEVVVKKFRTHEMIEKELSEAEALLQKAENNNDEAKIRQQRARITLLKNEQDALPKTSKRWEEENGAKKDTSRQEQAAQKQADKYMKARTEHEKKYTVLIQKQNTLEEDIASREKQIAETEQYIKENSGDARKLAGARKRLQNRELAFTQAEEKYNQLEQSRIEAIREYQDAQKNLESIQKGNYKAIDDADGQIGKLEEQQKNPLKHREDLIGKIKIGSDGVGRLEGGMYESAYNNARYYRDLANQNAQTAKLRYEYLEKEEANLRKWQTKAANEGDVDEVERIEAEIANNRKKIAQYKEQEQKELQTYEKHQAEMNKIHRKRNATSKKDKADLLKDAKEYIKQRLVEAKARRAQLGEDPRIAAQSIVDRAERNAQITTTQTAVAKTELDRAQKELESVQQDELVQKSQEIEEHKNNVRIMKETNERQRKEIEEIEKQRAEGRKIRKSDPLETEEKLKKTKSDIESLSNKILELEQKIQQSRTEVEQIDKFVQDTIEDENYKKPTYDIDYNEADKAVVDKHGAYIARSVYLRGIADGSLNKDNLAPKDLTDTMSQMVQSIINSREVVDALSNDFGLDKLGSEDEIKSEVQKRLNEASAGKIQLSPIIADYYAKIISDGSVAAAQWLESTKTNANANIEQQKALLQIASADDDASADMLDTQMKEANEHLKTTYQTRVNEWFETIRTKLKIVGVGKGKNATAEAKQAGALAAKEIEGILKLIDDALKGYGQFKSKEYYEQLRELERQFKSAKPKDTIEAEQLKKKYDDDVRALEAKENNRLREELFGDNTKISRQRNKFAYTTYRDRDVNANTTALSNTQEQIKNSERYNLLLARQAELLREISDVRGDEKKTTTLETNLNDINSELTQYQMASVNVSEYLKLKQREADILGQIRKAYSGNKKDSEIEPMEDNLANINKELDKYKEFEAQIKHSQTLSLFKDDVEFSDKYRVSVAEIIKLEQEAMLARAKGETDAQIDERYAQINSKRQELEVTVYDALQKKQESLLNSIKSNTEEAKQVATTIDTLKKNNADSDVIKKHKRHQDELARSTKMSAEQLEAVNLELIELEVNKRRVEQLKIGGLLYKADEATVEHYNKLIRETIVLEQERARVMAQGGDGKAEKKELDKQTKRVTREINQWQEDRRNKDAALSPREWALQFLKDTQKEYEKALKQRYAVKGRTKKAEGQLETIQNDEKYSTSWQYKKHQNDVKDRLTNEYRYSDQYKEDRAKGKNIAEKETEDYIRKHFLSVIEQQFQSSGKDINDEEIRAEIDKLVDKQSFDVMYRLKQSLGKKGMTIDPEKMNEAYSLFSRGGWEGIRDSFEESYEDSPEYKALIAKREEARTEALTKEINRIEEEGNNVIQKIRESKPEDYEPLRKEIGKYLTGADVGAIEKEFKIALEGVGKKTDINKVKSKLMGIARNLGASRTEIDDLYGAITENVSNIRHGKSNEAISSILRVFQTDEDWALEKARESLISKQQQSMVRRTTNLSGKHAEGKFYADADTEKLFREALEESLQKYVNDSLYNFEEEMAKDPTFKETGVPKEILEKFKESMRENVYKLVENYAGALEVEKGEIVNPLTGEKINIREEVEKRIQGTLAQLAEDGKLAESNIAELEVGRKSALEYGGIKSNEIADAEILREQGMLKARLDLEKEYQRELTAAIARLTEEGAPSDEIGKLNAELDKTNDQIRQLQNFISNDDILMELMHEEKTNEDALKKRTPEELKLLYEKKKDTAQQQLGSDNERVRQSAEERIARYDAILADLDKKIEANAAKEREKNDPMNIIADKFANAIKKSLGGNGGLNVDATGLATEATLQQVLAVLTGGQVVDNPAYKEAVATIEALEKKYGGVPSEKKVTEKAKEQSDGGSAKITKQKNNREELPKFIEDARKYANEIKNSTDPINDVRQAIKALGQETEGTEEYLLAQLKIQKALNNYLNKSKTTQIEGLEWKTHKSGKHKGEQYHDNDSLMKHLLKQDGISEKGLGKRLNEENAKKVVGVTPIIATGDVAKEVKENVAETSAIAEVKPEVTKEATSDYIEKLQTILGGVSGDTKGTGNQLKAIYDTLAKAKNPTGLKVFEEFRESLLKLQSGKGSIEETTQKAQQFIDTFANYKRDRFGDLSKWFGKDVQADATTLLGVVKQIFELTSKEHALRKEAKPKDEAKPAKEKANAKKEEAKAATETAKATKEQAAAEKEIQYSKKDLEAYEKAKKVPAQIVQTVDTNEEVGIGALAKDETLVKILEVIQRIQTEGIKKGGSATGSGKKRTTKVDEATLVQRRALQNHNATLGLTGDGRILKEYNNLVEQLDNKVKEVQAKSKAKQSTEESLKEVKILASKVSALGFNIMKEAGEWEAKVGKAGELVTPEDFDASSRETLKDSMEKLAQNNAGGKQYEFLNFDGKTLSYQLTDIKGNVEKVTMEWSELNNQVAITSEKSVSKMDVLAGKVETLQDKFKSALQTKIDGEDTVGYLDPNSKSLKKFEAQIANINTELAKGDEASFEKVEAMRENAIKLGAEVEREIAKNKRLYSGTTEVNAVEKQRVNIDARGGLAHEDLELVQQYNAEYTRLINKYNEFKNAGTLYDTDNQKELQGLALKVQNIGKRLESSVIEAEKLVGLVNDSGFYKDKKMGGQWDLSADEMNNLEATMKKYLNSLELGNFEHVKFDNVHKKLTATFRTSNKTVADLEMKYNEATGALYAYQKAERESLTGIPAFINGFKKKFNSIMQYLSMTMSIHQVLAELRKGVQYVREIDLALTELKKVTDETEESYDEFLKTAAKTGARLGSTISAVTEATATFAKLGYSMEQATEMAEAAIVYKNVGDNIASTEDAADSIISTMKGFKLEATESMAIVDRFNEVGNRFAITSQGIGEALRLSASALSEGGNSLDESIGLITAANEVVNDPSSVGKK